MELSWLQKTGNYLGRLKNEVSVMRAWMCRVLWVSSGVMETSRLRIDGSLGLVSLPLSEGMWFPTVLSSDLCCPSAHP